MGIAGELKNGVGKASRVSRRNDQPRLRLLNEIRGFALADKNQRLCGREDRKNLRGPGAAIGGNVQKRGKATQGNGIETGNLIERNRIVKSDILKGKLILQGHEIVAGGTVSDEEKVDVRLIFKKLCCPQSVIQPVGVAQSAGPKHDSLSL